MYTQGHSSTMHICDQICEKGPYTYVHASNFSRYVTYVMFDL